MGLCTGKAPFYIGGLLPPQPALSFQNLHSHSILLGLAVCFLDLSFMLSKLRMGFTPLLVSNSKSSTATTAGAPDSSIGTVPSGLGIG